MVKKFRPQKGATVATIAALALLLSLGFWQVSQLHKKETLLHTISTQMAAKASPLPEKIKAPEEWQYRRASVAGSYLNDKTFLLKPRTHDGQAGYHVLTLLQRVSGGFVFIDRGFVTDKNLKRISKPKGLVKADGIVMLPKKGKFTPENNAAKKDWYWADIAALAKEAGIKGALPVVLQAVSSTKGQYPVAVSPVPDIPNNHMQYAIFWFGMALILGIIYFIYHYREEEHGQL